MNVKFKKIVATLLFICIISLSFAYPHKTNALMAVIDVAVLASVSAVLAVETESASAWSWKEFVMDTLFYLLNNVIIERIAADIVTWINSGFEGKPAFVQDQKALFQQIEGTVIGSFLNEFDLGYMCSPFADRLKRSFQIQLALQQSGGRNGRESAFRAGSQCTLDQLASSLGTTYEEFSNDFSRGGWDMFLHTAQPQNNEYGMYLILRDELSARVGEEKDNQREELKWGSGFLSWKKKGDCISGTQTVSPDGNSGVDTCTEYAPDEIMTPGSVIENQLNQGLGSPLHRIEVADEINEIIGALLSQLINQVLGPDGLFGTSQSGSGSSSSYVDQLRTSEQNEQSLRLSLLPMLGTSEIVIRGYVAIQEQTKVRTLEVKLLLEQTRICPIGQVDQLVAQVNTILAGINATLTETTQLLTDIDAIQAGTGNISLERYQTIATEIRDVETHFNNANARLAQSETFAQLDAIVVSSGSQPIMCQNIVP